MILTCSSPLVSPLGVALPEFRNVPEIWVKLLKSLVSGIPEEKVR
jgi:hypothetical protein